MDKNNVTELASHLEGKHVLFLTCDRWWIMLSFFVVS